MEEKDILHSVDDVIHIVNKCVVNRDFTNMQRDIYKATAPMRNAESADARRWTQVPPKPRGNWREQNAGRPMNGGHMEGQGNAFRGNYRAPRQNEQGAPRPAVRRGPRFESVLFKKSDAGGAKAMFGIGLFGAIVTGSIGLLSFLTGMFFGAAFSALSLVMLVACLAFGFMSAVGSQRMHRMERYEKYRELLEEKQFARVSDLAAAVHLSEKKVRADLKSLSADGYFKQGHFDTLETHFIVSDEMYRMYQATEANAARMRREAAEKEAKENTIPAEVRELLKNGEAYIQRIHEANDKIPDEGISDKLYRMERIVTRIFAEVRKDPSLAGNLNMFMDYYLPTTIKLVEAYESMDQQDIPGENIRSAKAEISDSLDTINDAFEKLLDSFFADTAMDVSTDISVMKTMMKQEGLADDDLSAMRKKKQMQAQIENGPLLKDMEEDIYGLGEKNADGLVSMPLGDEEDF